MISQEQVYYLKFTTSRLQHYALIRKTYHINYLQSLRHQASTSEQVKSVQLPKL